MNTLISSLDTTATPRLIFKRDRLIHKIVSVLTILFLLSPPSIFAGAVHAQEDGSSGDVPPAESPPPPADSPDAGNSFTAPDTDPMADDSQTESPQGSASLTDEPAEQAIIDDEKSGDSTVDKIPDDEQQMSSLISGNGEPTVPNPTFTFQSMQPKIDKATGALTQRISLEIPPGRNGLQPDLALEYNSQRFKDSIVGYGWNISIPYIERPVLDRKSVV